ncbi:MAG TPA: DUF4426 domain-containing protein [Oceanospirillales bacterium]|nr:DUF4426 domain-containing protein [Oceanospirillales bacterium]
MFFIVLITLATVLTSVTVSAENSKSENGYEVHYNAFSSDFLTKEVAKNYQIGRSKTKGIINIAVLKQQEIGVPKSVKAKINLKAQNFYGQNKSVDLRMISENDGAIYYIGTFSVSSQETINFKASVLPDGSETPIEIKFSQEFFTN